MFGSAPEALAVWTFQMIRVAYRLDFPPLVATCPTLEHAFDVRAVRLSWKTHKIGHGVLDGETRPVVAIKLACMPCAHFHQTFLYFSIDYHTS